MDLNSIGLSTLAKASTSPLASTKFPTLWASMLLLSLPAAAQTPKQRLELPIADPVYAPGKDLDVRKVKPPARNRPHRVGSGRPAPTQES